MLHILAKPLLQSQPASSTSLVCRSHCPLHVPHQLCSATFTLSAGLQFNGAAALLREVLMQRHQQILMRQRGAIQRALRRCQLLALAFPENDEITEDVVILSSVI